MKLLSKYQSKIIDYMKNGWILVTNEGSDWKAWLEKDGQKITIRRNTAEILFNLGMIKPVEWKNGFGYVVKEK